MSKPKRKIKEVKDIEGILGRPNRQIITLGDEIKVKCKTCKKQPRRDGSAFCRQCANSYFDKVIKTAN